MTYNFPTSDKVFADIHPILVLICDSLFFGTKKTKAYLKTELPKKKIDPHLGSMLTRFWAKLYLQTHGQLVEDIVFKNTPLVGLILRYKNFHIRILKANNGEITGAGQSKRRQAFCEQFPIEFPLEDSDESAINLFALWIADGEFNLMRNEFSLACPKFFDADKSSIDYHWHKPFPNSILSESIQSIEEIQIHEAKQEDPKDLPLIPKKSGKEKKNDIGQKSKTRQRIKRIYPKGVR